MESIALTGTGVGEALDALIEVLGVPHAPRRAASDDAGMAAQLLSAIHADPADDGPRHVYADWLLERDDPRGEFIALQLARHGGTATDATIAREAALLRVHGRAWLGPLARMVRRHSAVFARGFLVRCELRDQSGETRCRDSAGEPGWATVEYLACSTIGSTTDPAPIFQHPIMRALRAVEWTPAETSPTWVPSSGGGPALRVTIRWSDGRVRSIWSRSPTKWTRSRR